MAPFGSRSSASDAYVPTDFCRSQPIHLTYVMLGFLAIGLLAPVMSALGGWRLLAGRVIYVSVDGQSYSYTSVRRTVADVLRAGKIEVRPGDRVSPTLETPVWTGIQITVVRAIPLTVTVRGVDHEVRLAAATAGEALSLMNVEVGPEDRVFPHEASALVPGARITVERLKTRTWIERTPIPFAVQTVADRNVLKGQQVVRSAGRPGVRQEIFQTEYVNGRRVAAQTLADTVASLPVPEVIATGTKPLIATIGPYAGREMMYLEATAYYPGPLNYGGGVGPRTAIGLMARHGVIAVDPSVIKLGTRVYVEGYGEAVAGDTGGAIQGRRIDLCFDTYDEAMQFGRRTVKVYVLKTP